MARRKFSKEYKARIALDALKETKTMAELASEYELHPVQITKWKKKAQSELPSVFADRREKKRGRQAEYERAEKLYEEIGRLKIQLDWVKKKSGIGC